MSTKPDPRDVIRSPVISEKSYALIEERRYTFVVHPGANKTEIRQAVETIFNVKVLNVNTSNHKGKRRRDRRTGVWGVTPARKHAIVTLGEGDAIEMFQA